MMEIGTAQGPVVPSGAPWTDGSVACGTTTRRLPLDEAARQLGIRPEAIYWPRQVHGATVVHVRTVDQEPAEADGLICAVPGMPFGIRTADCVPLFFYAPQPRVAGLAHVGWRGLAAGLPGHMVAVLRQQWGVPPAAIRVHMGPRIGGCCYEVGQELAQRFGEVCVRRGNRVATTASAPVRRRSDGGRWLLDIPGAVMRQLAAAGVPPAQITDSALCTACANDRFFSVRREGPITERLCSLMQLKPVEPV